MNQPDRAQARAQLFADRNFRWLLGGGVISMLGDQFTLIALPWLVLKLTGDPMTLGLVMAAMSIPRAVFMLIGGALVDRYSPKRVLMLTKHANTLLLGTLGICVLTGNLPLWGLYALAIGIGLATAFSYPSGSSIVPMTIPAEHLHAANGILMGLRQLSVLIGPLTAGLLIALFGHAGKDAVADATGLAIAFLFDAFSFAFSAWTLSKVQALATGNAAETPAKVIHAIAEALRHFWNDKALRCLCLYYAGIAFFIGGPIQVALPVVADTQLPNGAAGFGSLLAMHGAGTLVGMGLAGAKPNWRLGNLGMTLLAIDAAAGLLFLPLGQIHALWQGGLMLFPVGIMAGFIQVAIFTWMQKRVPVAMLGRAMSLFMFIFMGLSPFSAALTGTLMKTLSAGQLFIAAGSALVALVVLALMFTPIREIKDWRPETA